MPRRGLGRGCSVNTNVVTQPSCGALASGRLPPGLGNTGDCSHARTLHKSLTSSPGWVQAAVPPQFPLVLTIFARRTTAVLHSVHSANLNTHGAGFPAHAPGAARPLLTF